MLYHFGPIYRLDFCPHIVETIRIAYLVFCLFQTLIICFKKIVHKCICKRLIWTRYRNEWLLVIQNKTYKDFLAFGCMAKRGAFGQYPDFLLFFKNRSIVLLFKKLKYSPPTSIHFCHLCRSFCIPSTNHKVDILLRYRFTYEIKPVLVSYLFPTSLFFSSGNK